MSEPLHPVNDLLSLTKSVLKLGETVYNRAPNDKELSEILFANEQATYAAHRTARGRSPGPSRPRSQSPSSRRRSRSRSPRQNNRNAGHNNRGRGRGNSFSRGRGRMHQNGNSNRGNQATLQGLSEQLQQLQRRLADKN